jgi:hypothetical protein
MVTPRETRWEAIITTHRPPRFVAASSYALQSLLLPSQTSDLQIIRPSLMKHSLFSSFLPALAWCQSTTTTALPAWATGVETEDGTCGGTTGWVCTRPGALAAPPMDCAVDRPSFAERAGEFSHPQLAKESTNPSFSSQPLAGNCNQVVVPAPAPPPLGPGSPSPDGSCGGTSEYTCANATFGACCSSSGWCGDSTAHCSAGCQSKFGYCESGSDTVTTDGSCGSNGKTCKGSTAGNCCSVANYCGNTAAHCGSGW